jgi:hypothetical protein
MKVGTYVIEPEHWPKEQLKKKMGVAAHIMYRNPHHFKVTELEEFDAVLVELSAPKFGLVARSYAEKGVDVYRGLSSAQAAPHVVLLSKDKPVELSDTAPPIGGEMEGEVPVTYAREGEWEGEDCYIVGGGESLKEFDWSVLEGKNTIAINRAHEEFKPSIVFFTDHRFYQWVMQGVYGWPARESFLNPDVKRVMLCNNKFEYPDFIQILPSKFPVDIFTTTLKDGLCRSTNSTVSAMNLAWLMGAKRIFLLGVDCEGAKKSPKERVTGEEPEVQKHYHDGHPIETPDTSHHMFVQSFNTVAEFLKDKVEVINLNPDSAVRCFDFQAAPWDCSKHDCNEHTHKKEETTVGSIERETNQDTSSPPKEQPVHDSLEYPVFVSCYTPDYEQVADRLEESLDAFGLDFWIEEYFDRGSWEENCAYKAELIKHARKKFRGRNVVWVDADAVVKKTPVLFHEANAPKGGFMAHQLPNGELLSGTLFFGVGPKVSRLINLWIKENEANPGKWDQKNLQKVVEENQAKVGWEKLPTPYCKIFDNRSQQGVEAVIEHWQHSRIARTARAMKGIEGVKFPVGDA